jgi:tRNA G18 (ribose-2'-O)-methylase SpoU
MYSKKTGNQDLNRMSKEDFKNSLKSDVYIVLDNLRSGNNIGSIFRSADAFRIKKIYITGNSAIPPSKEILKTALGACETVDWEYNEDGLEVIENLKKNKIKVFSIEQASNSVSLENFNAEDNFPLALVFGNEVDGVNQDIIDASDACVEIPQFGSKHSLNVAVSSGIVMWHIQNQLLQNKEI